MKSRQGNHATGKGKFRHFNDYWKRQIPRDSKYHCGPSSRGEVIAGGSPKDFWLEQFQRAQGAHNPTLWLFPDFEIYNWETY